jgi:hypothetical protein
VLHDSLIELMEYVGAYRLEYVRVRKPFPERVKHRLDPRLCTRFGINPWTLIESIESREDSLQVAQWEGGVLSKFAAGDFT